MVVKCIHYIIWFNGYCFDMKYFVCLRVWDYACAKIQFTELWLCAFKEEVKLILYFSCLILWPSLHHIVSFQTHFVWIQFWQLIFIISHFVCVSGTAKNEILSNWFEYYGLFLNTFSILIYFDVHCIK